MWLVEGYLPNVVLRSRAEHRVCAVCFVDEARRRKLGRRGGDSCASIAAAGARM